MYEKAILFGDTKIANAILLADSPKKQKELGRQVRGYDDNIWGEKRYEIVAEINYLKFSQNEPFKSTLLSFAGWEFVEASPDDCIWGIGLSKEDPRALDKSKWRGQNLLGKAINSAQQRIIAEL